MLKAFIIYIIFLFPTDKKSKYFQPLLEHPVYRDFYIYKITSVLSIECIFQLCWSFLLCAFKCTFKLPRWLKPLLQILQTKGFSPVCTRICLSRIEGLQNNWPQKWQLSWLRVVTDIEVSISLETVSIGHSKDALEKVVEADLVTLSHDKLEALEELLKTATEMKWQVYKSKFKNVFYQNIFYYILQNNLNYAWKFKFSKF